MRPGRVPSRLSLRLTRREPLDLVRKHVEALAQAWIEALFSSTIAAFCCVTSSTSGTARLTSWMPVDCSPTPRDQDDQRNDEQKNFRDNAAAKAVATERIFLAKPALAPTKLGIALLIVHRAIDLFWM
ncbi:hypothetical protein [Rhizobium mongolense]|uniref:Uncharacterized protein n=1 Tax=Rhizobium mongolense TaxID=57676 RepID=A0ABR6ILC8_9HYPH|nr:hypothetical protein [Rhizobium mongolense]MBB4228690.1 hypothetical protein [Rhizobium mongolense]